MPSLKRYGPYYNKLISELLMLNTHALTAAQYQEQKINFPASEINQEKML